MRKWLVPIGVAALVAAALFMAGGRMWRDRAHAAPERFILIVIDSLRADHLGCYGSPHALTPNIDALAAQGVRFSKASAASSYTFASNAALLTGMYPHEVRDRSPSRIADQAMTLAECFQAAGYETAAFSAHFIISTRSHFEQGFDFFMHADRQDDAMVTRCRNWLSRHAEDRYFVLLYLWNPHLPYRPNNIAPELQAQLANMRPTIQRGWPPAGREVRRPRITEHPSSEAECSLQEVELLHALYNGAIRDADERVGRVLEQVGDDPGTVVALLADHGEEFLDHDGLRHMLTLYRELLDVPFILRAPGEAPRVVETPVSNLDVLPTLLGLAGIRPPSGLRGQPVLGDFEPRPLFSECGYCLSHELLRCAVRLRDQTLIYSLRDLANEPPVPDGGIWEHYDLSRDPGQHQPLEVGPGSDDLRALLEGYYKQAEKRIKPYASTAPKQLDDDLLDKLRALGYTAH